MEYDIQSTNLRSETKRRQIYQIKYTFIISWQAQRAYSRKSFVIRTKQLNWHIPQKQYTELYTQIESS